MRVLSATEHLVALAVTFLLAGCPLVAARYMLVSGTDVEATVNRLGRLGYTVRNLALLTTGFALAAVYHPTLTANHSIVLLVWTVALMAAAEGICYWHNKRVRQAGLSDDALATTLLVGPLRPSREQP